MKKYELFEYFINSNLNKKETYKKFKNEFKDIEAFLELLDSNDFDDYFEMTSGRQYQLMKYKFFIASNIIISDLIEQLPSMDFDEKQKIFSKVVSFINSLEAAERSRYKGSITDLPSFESLKLDIQ